MPSGKHVHRLRNVLQWIFFACWFAGWHLWHTWAVWQDPLRRVPGPIGDNTVMLWNLGWVDYALNHGQPGFWFTNAYYPEGFLFLFGTHTWLYGVLRWIASPVLPDGIEGSILWANIFMLLATVLSGLFAISALHAWGVRLWTVLLAGSSALVFAWFRMFALTGHYHFYGTEWMLCCLALLSWGRYHALQGDIRLSNRLVVAAGVMLGITFLNDQTMAVFAGLLGGLICVSIILQKSGTYLQWRNFYTPVRFYGWALLPASVHLIPIAGAIAEKRFHYVVDTHAPRLVDASSLLLPPDRHMFGTALHGFREANGLFWAEGSYLGITSMLLLILLIIEGLRYLLALRHTKTPVQPRMSIIIGGVTLVFLLFALGDTFIIGKESHAALPGRLLKIIPGLNAIRLPQRWVWPAQICLVLGGTLTVQRLLLHSGKKWMQWAVLLIAFLPPIEGQSYPPAPPVDFRNDTFLQPPGVVDAVKTNYTSGSVLLMPTELAYAHSNIFQFLWGYDIPATISYTARMPVDPRKLPWKGNQWTPQAGDFLRQKDVTMLVFPYPERPEGEFDDWIKNAKTAVPGLKVVKSGGLVP